MDSSSLFFSAQIPNQGDTVVANEERKEEEREFFDEYCDGCGCPEEECECGQGTPDDAATDFAHTWSPQRKYAVVHRTGDKGHDE